MPSKFFLLSVWSPKGFPFRCVHLTRVYFYFPRISENFLLSLSLFGVSEGFSSEGFSPLHVGFFTKVFSFAMIISEVFLLSFCLFGAPEGFSPLHVGFPRKFYLSLYFSSRKGFVFLSVSYDDVLFERGFRLPTQFNSLSQYFYVLLCYERHVYRPNYHRHLSQTEEKSLQQRRGGSDCSRFLDLFVGRGVR